LATIWGAKLLKEATTRLKGKGWEKGGQKKKRVRADGRRLESNVGKIRKRGFGCQ